MSLAGLLQAHEAVTKPRLDCERIDSAYASQRKAPKFQRPKVLIQWDSVERESWQHKRLPGEAITELAQLRSITRTRTLCAVLPDGSTVALHSGSAEVLAPLVKSAEQTVVALRHKLPVRDGFPLAVALLVAQHGYDVEFSVLG